jgi:hypothetical protein
VVLFDEHRQLFCSVALLYIAALLFNFICHSSPHLSLQGITLEEHRRQVKCFAAIFSRKINVYSQMQLEALRLAVQAESAPAPVRQVVSSISAAFVRDTPIFR